MRLQELSALEAGKTTFITAIELFFSVPTDCTMREGQARLLLLPLEAMASNIAALVLLQPLHQ